MVKSNHRKVLIWLSFLIAGLFIFWGIRIKTDNSGKIQSVANSFRKILKGADQNEPSKIQSKSGRSLKFASARAKGLFDGRMDFLDVANFDDYLKNNNRSARSLAAVYYLTMDKSILAELENHLDSPEALLCLSRNPFTTKEKKLEYAKMYCKLKPDEMQGYMIAAFAALILNKDPAEVLDWIQKGMYSDKVSIGFELTNDLRDAMKSTGRKRIDSEIYIIKTNHFPASLLGTEVEMIEFGSKTEMNSAPTEEAKIEIINKYLSTSESVKELAEYANRMAQSDYYNVVYKLLEQLPPNADLGGGKGTVADYRAKNLNERLEWGERNKLFFDAMSQISTEKFEQYIEQRIQNGETAAITWLINEGHH